ncbi:MAG: hypothetical protein M3Y65_15750, partial [Pseudomonadota bacterium]|nr:hypothetical protein [Pseudomonadota bacterium]
VLETAIGLIFVFLLVSMLVTIVNEMLAALLSSRARCLGRGLAWLIGTDWMQQMYAHPLISGAAAKEPPSLFRRGPAYIPSRAFANVLMSIVQHDQTAVAMARRALRALVDTATCTGIGTAAFTLQLQTAASPQQGRAQEQGADRLDAAIVADLLRYLVVADQQSPHQTYATILRFIDRMRALYLRQTLEALPVGDLRTALLTLFDDAHNDPEKMKENIEVWFNSGMDRVNGWYKRRTQVVVAILSLGMAVALNVDTLLIVRHLQTWSGARDAIVMQATQFVQDVPAPASVATPTPTPTPTPDQRFRTVQQNLATTALPLGWVVGGSQAEQDNGQALPQSGPAFRKLLLQHGLGWILTALAASLGAPFWFDMLNRVVAIRATGKPPGEAPKPPNAVSAPVEPGQTPREADRLRQGEPR